MKDTLKQFGDKFKAFWGGLGKGVKRLIIGALIVLVVGALVAAIAINVAKAGWLVLFPDMSTEESAEVYKELQEMNVETRINSDGEIEVREEEWDTLVYELAEKGYPQSAPSYGTFFDNLSMTMSEFEKKETLRFELQNRLQTTLKRIDGIKGAIVTISFPESSSYAWKPDEGKATANVTLTLENPKKFSPEQVTAVKNIVAYSAQKIEPENVSVVDATSGKELKGLDEDTSDVMDTEDKIDYANLIKNQYETNAEKILEPIYGAGNVTAAAHVDIDYDKITQEVKELTTDENGEGVKETQHIKYKTDGTVDNGGVVGEEDNTDIPNYGNLEDNLNSDNTPEYERDTEWAIGYILTQTEKAQGGIKSASIGVVVATETGTLTEEETESLRELVSNATNIDLDNVSVKATLLNAADTPADTGDAEEPEESGILGFLKKNWWIFVIAAAVLVLLTIIIISSIINKKAKKKIAAAHAESQAQIESMKKSIEEENNKKMTIEEAAKEHTEASNATANEVKEFAKKNPEIAAALIRSMMKEQQ